jgi:hypothetical protein
LRKKNKKQDLEELLQRRELSPISRSESIQDKLSQEKNKRKAINQFELQLN